MDCPNCSGSVKVKESTDIGDVVACTACKGNLRVIRCWKQFVFEMIDMDAERNLILKRIATGELVPDTHIDLDKWTAERSFLDKF